MIKFPLSPLLDAPSSLKNMDSLFAPLHPICLAVPILPTWPEKNWPTCSCIGYSVMLYCNKGLHVVHRADVAFGSTAGLALPGRDMGEKYHDKPYLFIGCVDCGLGLAGIKTGTESMGEALSAHAYIAVGGALSSSLPMLDSGHGGGSLR